MIKPIPVNEEWLKILDEKEKLVSSSVLSRFLREPQKYFYSLWLRKITYPRTKKGVEKKCKTFWGDDFIVKLPAGNDIYLTGTKSYFAELRQAKFLVKQLKPGDTYLDVGAHFGYFSLLASRLTGENGKVISFEPTRTTFEVLKRNVGLQKNTQLVNLAVSDHEGEVIFTEFDQFYSENNSANPAENKLAVKAEQYPVKTVSLSKFCADSSIIPNMIKIDAEGLELEVVKGMKDLIRDHSPVILMEFAGDLSGDNKNYFEAAEILKSFGYESFLIDRNGDPERTDDLMKNIREMGVESDNIVFMKKL